MANFNNKEFGEKLKKARKDLGYTQENLAYDVNLSTTTISRFESGELIPNIEQVCKICNALGIYITDLVGTSNKVINKENSKNPFNTNKLYLYYNGVLPAKNKQAKLKFRLDFIEKPDMIEVNFVDYKTEKIYMTGYMLSDTNVAILVLENYKPSSPRLEVTKIVINISNNINGIMLGALSATNGQYVPNERKCIVSKKDLEFNVEIDDMLKVSDDELQEIKDINAWYMKIDNVDDYES